MDSNATPDQKEKAEAVLALFGCIFWDNDWFAIDNNPGETTVWPIRSNSIWNTGLRSAAADSSQPFLATKVPPGSTTSSRTFNQYFGATGAAAGSTQYQSAFFEPLILNYLNSSQTGVLSMSDPKWAAYGKWELSIQTPPEPRFGNIRKGYSNGDGNTMADVRTGMLATALYSTNMELAGNLMWAWQQSNSATTLTEDQQFVTTLMAIDLSIPPSRRCSEASTSRATIRPSGMPSIHHMKPPFGSSTAVFIPWAATATLTTGRFPYTPIPRRSPSTGTPTITIPRRRDASCITPLSSIARSITPGRPKVPILPTRPRS